MTIFIIAAGLILDRITKLWAVNSLSKISEITIIENFFSFFYTENKGAAFSIFQGRTTFLTIISIVIMCFIIFYIVKYRPRNKFMRISLALIISGALGNLIDRIKYKYVVDFISVHYKDIYYFPIFNVADIMVVIGTLILVICLLRDEKHGN
ncbi:MAG: signal peptidase II [Clostridium sp.]|jgi:signal peptidase II|uniref:signal peptidase II n=1 Tax=Clostridium sp. TaxID=1506 RepID=UPI0025C49E55|nr:signal peptidase II [Clostridium sp.]MCH3964177.1 signal peptidase II [Clostridium sp.]MCI1715358.1 signal peptidase II [Clostridium sp.]MCI1799851.1 signal peptidase II [Clostridium sp.]MCI1813541.1 signal peptidase II [Clostridium sp.]MCI1870669.1 signal peptidase II [Clostridium sp.]